MNRDKKRILVIEDDAEMRSVLKDFLEEDGFSIEVADDGSEAFGKLAGKTFDLIISDIRMPGFSGLDILPGLKKIQPGISVVLITAFGSDEVRRRAPERGADAYLEKPVHFGELGELIEKMLSSTFQGRSS